ncbi:hypothetical protein ACCS53_39740 [Rhizobium ruizarguesonis]
MPAFKDMTAEIDEPNYARMGFRTKARIKTAIQRAAALSVVARIEARAYDKP